MAYSNKIELTLELLQDIDTAFMHHRLWSSWFIDLESNEVIFFTKEIYFDPEFREYVEHEASRNRFIPIPSRDSEKSWNQVHRFINLQKDGDLKKQMIQATEARPRFQPFLDVVEDAGLGDEWYEFSQRLDWIDILEWLSSLELINEEGLNKGKQLCEVDLARWRNRFGKENIGKGAIVICSDNTGLTDQITPGQTYQVLDEQKQQLSIQIKDNRGKITWIPKAHFELVTEA